MKHEVAGSPMGGLRWTSKSTEKIACELRKIGIEICANTVGKLLKQMKFSLRVNRKWLESATTLSPEDRDRQFVYISERREEFAAAGDPVISVDTKKKELVGNFKNNGKCWEKEAVKVNDHDFRSQAEGRAVPYGIYDVRANAGWVEVGASHDTPGFAVDAIEGWWLGEDRKRYPDAGNLLILADCGGSNGYRLRAWKWQLQQQLCNRLGLSVTVSHYPAGTSKYNPIEHRLFSEISKNWAGKPLTSFERIVKFIRATGTSTGLKVKASLNANHYAKGQSITDAQIDELNLTRHETFPQWNYSLAPDIM